MDKSTSHHLAFENILLRFERPNDDVFWWGVLVKYTKYNSAHGGVMAIALYRYDDGGDRWGGYYSAESLSV